MRKSKGEARRSIYTTGTIQQLQPNPDTAAWVQQRQVIRREDSTCDSGPELINCMHGVGAVSAGRDGQREMPRWAALAASGEWPRALW